MAAPDAGDAVNAGQFGIGMGGDVRHREITGVERVGQTAESQRRGQPQRLRARTGNRHPVIARQLAADNAQYTHCQRDSERQDQRKVA